MRIVTILLLMLSAALCSCRHHDPTPEPPEEPAPMTLLIYMAANTNLNDRADIDEMLTAARSGALAGGSRVLLYWAEPGGRRQQLAEVTSGTLRTLRDFATDLPATSATRLREAIDAARTEAPAERYGLVLWSHATGWPDTSAPSTLSFGRDNASKLEMSIPDLGRALAPGEFEFIYFDCCLMMGIEVAYELRHAARYLCGSVTETPAAGLPYDRALPYLLTGTATALDANARAVMDTYGTDSFGRCPVSAVVVATEGLDSLAALTARIYAEAPEAPAQRGLQQFFYSSKTPLYRYTDLEQYVEHCSPQPAVQALWRECLERVVLSNYHSDYVWTYYPIERHCGLSTRPVNTPELGYHDLQWWQHVSHNLITP